MKVQHFSLCGTKRTNGIHVIIAYTLTIKDVKENAEVIHHTKSLEVASILKQAIFLSRWFNVMYNQPPLQAEITETCR